MSLRKSAVFGDIHFGKKANSHVHNRDCMNFIDWFCEMVRKDSAIDHIVFLGDWFENRSAINIATMTVAHEAASKLNSLGLPVYFIVGNHDLYHRHTRDIHSLVAYQEFDNFTLIESPTVIKDIHGTVLMSPFLFHDEYPDLQKYLSVPIWYGHFEFKGFEITGAGMRMPTGPEAKNFVGPTFIFSGHFHKRQAHEQIIFVGNTFPMDFGDAGDNHRGMMVYDYINEEPIFHDWDAGPKYVKTSLSAIIDKSVKIYPEARVKCVVDIPISFEESSRLQQIFQEEHKLRELTMEESPELATALEETETDVNVNDQLKSVNELVLQMLMDIESDHIDNQLIINEYRRLKV